jgi:diguanylate cyclase (GGDEF)-like protein
VQDNIRESDTLTRIGGEEFAVIMPEIGKRRAVEIMERIRRAVASAPFDFSTEDHNTSVTVSIGIAGFPDDASSPDALYGQSDKALYRAKENGRNRIESAGESIPRQLSR